MCRLALMNSATISLLGVNTLAALFEDLESSFGGQGNGVAALWSETGAVKIHKGMTFTSAQAAAKVVTYASHGADWILFHTRLATSGGKLSQNCHPFRSGQLVMAHNGHSHIWSELGSSIGISDSECITQTWSRLRLPLTSLEEVDGVFLGFRDGIPFVVKGRSYDDLTVSVNEEAGAILFASDLHYPFRRFFEHTVEAGRFLWFGSQLDIWTVEPRPIATPRYTKYLAASTPTIVGTKVSTTVPLATPSADDEKVSSSITLADLRSWYERMDEEGTAASPDFSPSAPESVSPTPADE